MDSDIPLDPAALLNASEDEKWELLKPVIERLYLTDRLPLSEVIEKIQAKYDFHAIDHQYKYHINRKWKLSKYIRKHKKEAIVSKHQQRAAIGKSSLILHRDHEIPSTVLRRHLKEERRRAQKSLNDLNGKMHALERRPSLLENFPTSLVINWNMPHGAMHFFGRHLLDHSSPMAISTPSDVVMRTPPADQAGSPSAAPSPLSVALHKKTMTDRANLFIAGKYDDLLKSLNATEKQSVSVWLYQFWYFSYITAKHWGFGPRNWTSDLLGFEVSKDTQGLQSATDNFKMTTANQPGLMASPCEKVGAEKPTPLCKWSIHTFAVDTGYEIDNPNQEEDLAMDENSANNPWPQNWNQPEIQDRLRNALEHNHFSSVPVKQLPMAVSTVLKSKPRSQEDLLLESITFAIMGRNVDLLDTLLNKASDLKPDYTAVHPLHLAITYLDGSKTCCNILDTLLQSLPMQLKTNDLGLTLFDSLMIVVLKSHTSCPPADVHHSWRGQLSYPGADIDVCGRWDAESSCWRALIARGQSLPPHEWKHKFCHTSAQAVCHCFHSIKYSQGNFENLSGLFVAYCPGVECGMKLELGPLHVLVVVAYHLSIHGCPGEDLFGVLAVLLTLLSMGVSPLTQSDISIPILLHQDDDNLCTHRPLRPLEMASEIQEYLCLTWTEEIRIGWQIMVTIFERSERQWDPSSWAERDRMAALIYKVNEDDPFGLAVWKSTGFSNAEEHNAPNRDMFGGGGGDGGKSQTSDASDEVAYFRKDATAECMCRHFGWENYNRFAKDGRLGTLWALVRTEMLTYRRLAEGDPWNSENCNMEALLHFLETGDASGVGLLSNELMSENRCVCGRFHEDFWAITDSERVSQQYFANLEDWNRITVIPPPPRVAPEFYVDSF